MASDLAAIVKIRKALEKKFSDTTELFPDFTTRPNIAVIPTRSAILNTVTGLGGIPRGRVTEIFGAESSGKTTIATELVAELQRRDPNGMAMYVDYEHAFDHSYAHALGVDLNLDRFIFVQPDNFEQGDLIIDEFITNNIPDIIIIDSAAAMTPKDEMEGKADEKTRIGLQSQLMSKMLGRITKKLSRGRKPALVILNQVRTKINIKDPRQTGPDSAGGHALRFYASIRIKLENIGGEGDENRNSSGQGTDQIYTRSKVRITCIKNKLAPPFMRGQVVIDYGTGINNVISIGELAESKLGIMSGSGFYKYSGDTPGTSLNLRGRDLFHQELMKNSALCRELEGKVLAKIQEQMTKGLGLRKITLPEVDESSLVLLTDKDPVVTTSEGGLAVEDV